MIQEEVENRMVNLVVTTSIMTASAILSGIRTYLYYHNHNKVNAPYKHGKQSVNFNSIPVCVRWGDDDKI